jgi:phage recombination protein Bet
MVSLLFAENTMTTTRKRRAPASVDAQTLPDVRLAAPSAVLAELGIDLGTWKVLTESIFPSAKTPEGVLLAVRYCQARKLDIMRRPVHVVPMWSKALGREVETVWPGIAEVQTTAARTGQWAGMDAARFGPDKTRTFNGRVKINDDWQDLQVTVTFPDWCEVTVYRVVQGTRCPFTETVWWEETYARAGGARSEVPTDMWVKRPHGQLLKCAKAASLRAAFPEEADYTAEEMEGKVIEADGVPVTGEPPGAAIEPAQGVDHNATPSADGETAAPDDVVDDAAREQIERLIARAAKVGAWGQAEEYCRSRFTGAALAFALAELGHAKDEARAKTTQRQAA